MIAGIPPSLRPKCVTGGTVTVVLHSGTCTGEDDTADPGYDDWTVVVVHVEHVNETTPGDVFLAKCRELDGEQIDFDDLCKEAPEPIEAPAYGPHVDAVARSHRQPLLLVVGQMARPPPAVAFLVLLTSVKHEQIAPPFSARLGITSGCPLNLE